MKYTHLTTEERESILRIASQGLGIRSIAAQLGRSPSTISRELSRNARANGLYSPSEASALYAQRRKACRPAFKLADEELRLPIQDRLREGWSPEQIVGRLGLEKGGEAGVSAPTIYRAFGHGLLFHGARGCLRRGGKPYRKEQSKDGRGHIKNAVSISQRPKEADRREEIGHWEGDTVLGRPGSGGIVTLVERKSRYVLIGKIPDKTSSAAHAAIVSLLGQVDRGALRSLTLDNGKEFAWHEKISTDLSGLSVYFAHPGRPDERGTNENTNGLIRGYLPKGMDFRNVSQEGAQAIQDRLNSRPRKCLGFLTPNEVFRSALLHLT